jgi:hypothetical protein
MAQVGFMPAQISTKYVRLNWEDKGGVVVVTPRDENRFAIQLSKAIDALQRADQETQFREQFNLLLSVLGEWIKSHDDVGQAYLTLRNGSLAFVVVQKAKEYNAGLQDALAELDLRIAQDDDLNLIELNTIALPLVADAALELFLDPRLKLIYTDGVGD